MLIHTKDWIEKNGNAIYWREHYTLMWYSLKKAQPLEIYLLKIVSNHLECYPCYVVHVVLYLSKVLSTKDSTIILMVTCAEKKSSEMLSTEDNTGSLESLEMLSLSN